MWEACNDGLLDFLENPITVDDLKTGVISLASSRLFEWRNTYIQKILTQSLHFPCGKGTSLEQAMTSVLFVSAVFHTDNDINNSFLSILEPRAEVLFLFLFSLENVQNLLDATGDSQNLLWAHIPVGRCSARLQKKSSIQAAVSVHENVIFTEMATAAKRKAIVNFMLIDYRLLADERRLTNL